MTDLAERLRDAAPAPSAPLDVDLVAHRARNRRRRQRSALALATIGVVVALVAGVVMLQRPEGDSLELIGPPDPIEGVAPDSWVRLMARLPRQSAVEQRPLGGIDLARARRALGIEPLPSGSDDLLVHPHLDRLLRGIGTSVFGSRPLASSQLRAELGFGLEDIDQTVSGGAPPGEITIATGRFDPAAIESAVRDDPTWGARLETKEYRGFRYYSWGEDYQTSADITPTRSLGRGGRLVVGDGWISWTFGDAEARATIDAALDARRSLVTIDAVRAAAVQADAADLSFLSLLPMEARPSGTGTLVEPNLPAIDRPSVIFYGRAAASDQPITQFSLVYTDAEQAAANRDPLVVSIQQLLGSTTAEVSQTDQLLTVLFAADHSSEPFEVVFRLNYRADDVPPLERPALPDPRPTQDEALADGEISDEEYELAFWTYVECAERAGAAFGTIRRDEGGQFHYSVRTEFQAADACYNQHFFDVDRVWQVAND